MSSRFIHIVAGCYLNDQDELLIVRKRGTAHFILPGGKPESEESDIDTLTREWKEELGIAPEGAIKPLGNFIAPAANEGDYMINASLYHVPLVNADTLHCAAEIEEFIWYPIIPSTDGIPMERNTVPDIQLAPLLEEQILPILQQAHTHSA